MVIEIQSWTDLHERLFEDSWNEQIGRFRSRYAFRGMDCSNFPLTTSLMRLGGDYPSLERHLLRNFKKYSTHDVVSGDTEWHWMSIAQHHGLPTRLLDWTYSPYIALHFATGRMETFDQDAAVWAVDYTDVHNHLPDDLRGLLQQEGSDVFTAELINASIRNLDELDRLNEILLFYEPPSLDARIVNQHALFSLLNNPTKSVDQWLVENEGLRWKKLIIPARLKWEVRDKLDQANITERVVFPGLDGLCQWLRRQYTAVLHPKQ